MLVQSDGNTLKIDSIELLHKHKQVTVYNMTVDEFHTYFVSDLGIWVHNSNCEWTAHGYKHFASKNMTWKDTVISTKSGPAKYVLGTDVEALERNVWENGTQVTNGKTWKVMKFDKVIGASEGVETQYVRVEYSGGTIHGHPITQAEYNKLLK
ncbi:polymorphic toxin-type HINT domain-containing protein [Paenibacillus urinalis]|uniref:Polymorphic toxin-type HINT domain-containing protein n=1 Tax=Paenibacillus urinalis TaxID=521520 RepID=A0AAX3MVP7_9BACL|nr:MULTISPECIES: polymorphic toxin-type HINT domain-containing protein [Paenibacillus]WDH80490.1 polymorphic toxin-type HINT domain-containing protein [Paenibacillus urinalis]WDH96531.1 polymorphic toxin-type HINT domain-containing protein [Paenibacillus urinalis]WDI00177.1 polymorphic toxin-type HINT domain-containing protein [Paenibacillus urinalis]GAK40673.1 hypothetical protein TCA2_3163 [Paenibacillus sp. TCA20]